MLKYILYGQKRFGNRLNKIPDSMFTLSSPILAIVDVIESRRPSSLA